MPNIPATKKPKTRQDRLLLRAIRIERKPLSTENFSLCGGQELHGPMLTELYRRKNQD